MATTAAVSGQLAASAPRQGGSYSGMDDREAKYNAAMTGKSGGMTTNADGEMYDADAVYRPANQADHIHNQYLDDRKKEQEKVSYFMQLLKLLGWKPRVSLVANEGLSVREYVEKLEQRNKGIIDPRLSHFIGNWDLVTLGLLLFTTLITPYEVVFLSASQDVTGLFVLNRFVDGCFIFDMYIQFNLAYQAKPEDGGGWVMVRAAIRSVPSSSGVTACRRPRARVSTHLRARLPACPPACLPAFLPSFSRLPSSSRAPAPR